MADKQQPTDAAATLGTILEGDEGRDAVHVAVVAAVAGHPLLPGEHVGFANGVASLDVNPVGIVDPFLRERVWTGQRFWLFLYPRTITGLRHVWTHPAFPDEAASVPVEAASVPVEAGESGAVCRLRDFAEELDVTYEALIRNAKRHVETGAYWHGGEKFEGVHVPDSFWDDFEEATGIAVKDKDRGSFFSCSC